jgi:hypothetical protein
MPPTDVNIPEQTADAVAQLPTQADGFPIDLYPVDALSPAEQRELLDKVRDLHALAMFVKENAPNVLAAMNDNPIVKMLGGGKLFG